MKLNLLIRKDSFRCLRDEQEWVSYMMVSNFSINRREESDGLKLAHTSVKNKAQISLSINSKVVFVVSAIYPWLFGGLVGGLFPVHT